MQPPAMIPLKATYLEQTKEIGQQKKVDNVLQGLSDINSLKDEQVKELKKILVEKGLTTEFVLSKYKAILDMKGIEYRGADVLKALERLERLWGLDDKNEETLTIRALTQSKSASEITTTLIEITGKTQEYIKKLQEIKES